jgi:hypothetical protein
MMMVVRGVARSECSKVMMIDPCVVAVGIGDPARAGTFLAEAN